MSNDNTDSNTPLDAEGRSGNDASQGMEADTVRGTLGALAQQALDAAKLAQRDNHTGPGPLSDARHAYELANDALTQARETAMEIATDAEHSEIFLYEDNIWRGYLIDADDYQAAAQILDEVGDILRTLKP